MNSLSLALRNLRWRAGRSLVVVAILALGLVVYLFYSFFLAASAGKTGAAARPLQLPGGAVAYFPSGVQRPDDLRNVFSDQDLAGAELAITGEVAGPLGRLRALGFGAATGGATTPDSPLALGGLTLAQGAWPQQNGEVALDAAIAKALNLAPAAPGGSVGPGASGSSLTLAYLNELPGQSGFKQAIFKVTGVFTAKAGAADVAPQVVFTGGGMAGLTGLPVNTVYFPVTTPARAAAIGQAIASAAADYRAPSFVRTAYLRPYNIQMSPVLLTAVGPAQEAAALRFDVFLPGGEAIGLVFVFVGLGVFTVLLLSFLERKREVAILKTVGLDGRDIGTVFSLEAFILGTAGAMVGLVLTWVLMAVVEGGGGGAGTSAGLAAAASGQLAALRDNLAFSLGAIVRGMVFIYILVFTAAWLPMSMAQAATVNQLLFDQPIRLFYRRVSSYQ